MKQRIEKIICNIEQWQGDQSVPTGELRGFPSELGGGGGEPLEFEEVVGEEGGG